jgi:hypothetical protein
VNATMTTLLNLAQPNRGRTPSTGSRANTCVSCCLELRRFIDVEKPVQHSQVLESRGLAVLGSGLCSTALDLCRLRRQQWTSFVAGQKIGTREICYKLVLGHTGLHPPQFPVIALLSLSCPSQVFLSSCTTSRVEEITSEPLPMGRGTRSPALLIRMASLATSHMIRQKLWSSCFHCRQSSRPRPLSSGDFTYQRDNITLEKRDAFPVLPGRRSCSSHEGPQTRTRTTGLQRWPHLRLYLP